MSAALEFAVQALRVKHIVVLGHARCGGIRAYAEEGAPLSPGDFIGRWMALIAPAAARIGPPGAPTPEYLSQFEPRRACRSLDNLMTFPCVDTGRARAACVPRRLFRRRHRTLSVLDRATGVFAVAGDPGR